MFSIFIVLFFKKSFVYKTEVISLRNYKVDLAPLFLGSPADFNFSNLFIRFTWNQSVPEGWLWHKINPVAPNSNADLNTFRTSTRKRSPPPLLSCAFR
jgi:hypothetical protein